MKPSKDWFAAHIIRALCVTASLAFLAFGVITAQPVNPWKQPSESLSAQIAGILGPGPAAFTIRNLSSIPADELPSIQKSLEESLKNHGVTPGGEDSASIVRVTLSESSTERLWVAEVTEGNETKVAIVELDPLPPLTTKASGVLVLRRQTLVTSNALVLAALEIPSGLLTLEPERIALYTNTSSGWQQQQHADLKYLRSVGRDPRGILIGTTSSSSFEAWLPGVHCTGTLASISEAGALKIECRDSDDPWVMTQPPLNLGDNGLSTTNETSKLPVIHAFYNAARNSFTGVLSPSLGPDLPPFYALTVTPHLAGTATLIEGVDGKVQIIENGSIHAIAGTRDWGSDFAGLQSGCGAGTQIIVSGSGDAASDSLRAYELPSSEAIPVSESLAVNGSVIALNAAPDTKSVLAIVRHADNRFEVDRVTALCN